MSNARVLRILTAFVCLALAAVPWWLALGEPDHADFDQYWYGGRVERDASYTDTDELLRRADADGAHPTRDDVYGPPTLMALFFVPASFVPLRTAARLYLVGALVLLLYAVRRAAPRPWPPWFLGICLLPGTLFALALGQASLVTLALLLIAYAAARDGAETRAGLLIGVATAWKLYPAFLVLALIAHRRWRAVRTAVATVAAAGAATVAVLGTSGMAPAGERTLDVGGLVGRYPQNQSVAGVMARVLDVDWPSRWFSLALLVAGGWWVLLRLQRALALHETLAVAVVVMLAAQSITWSHYISAGVLVLFALLARGRLHGAVGALVVAAVVFLAWPADRASLPTDTGWSALKSAYDMWAVVALLAAAAVGLRGPMRTHVQRPSEPVR